MFENYVDIGLGSDNGTNTTCRPSQIFVQYPFTGNKHLSCFHRVSTLK